MTFYDFHQALKGKEIYHNGEPIFKFEVWDLLKDNPAALQSVINGRNKKFKIQ